MGKRDVKSINSLMKYLRDTHGISIKGSAQKRKLRNIGYYHGFKGYRYIGDPANRIAYTDFDQLIAINDFDMKLKVLFYPHLMFIETALKNYVLEIVLRESQSKEFNYIYSTLITDYKKHTLGSSEYRKAIRKRFTLRDTVYGGLTKNYSRGTRVVEHFYHKDSSVPIWAIFETFTLGTFGSFVSCLNLSVRRQISLDLGLNQRYDSDAKLPHVIIFVIKELRNAVAHNNAIFDARFRASKIRNQLIDSLACDTNISKIDFKSIVDYLILIIYILKNLKVPRTEMKRMINEFERLSEALRLQLPISIYSAILPTDTRNKLKALRTFVSI